MKNLIPFISSVISPVLSLARGFRKQKLPSRRWARGIAVGAVVGLAFLGLAGKPSGKYVAHEWGTFTSVQGSDGKLLEWHPLESSRLPGFVYDWSRPGFGRRPSSELISPKVELSTLQRMETPVIYFYSKQPQSVDVEVRFPKGLITEWYPQATQIGPSTTAAPWLVSKLDDVAHKSGVKPGFTFASLLSTAAASDSRARWARVDITPNTPNSAPSLPQDSSGSHYFAARETDANFVAVPALLGTNTSAEHEKFIFYRGVGNFGTPLRVTESQSGQWTLSNTGDEALTDLFLLTMQQGHGRFIFIDRLPAGEQRTIHANSKTETLALETLSEKLGTAMEAALEKHGLFRREAVAMVHTWKDSWFQEDGERVLYILPRAWTDHILPLKLDPQPVELTRVMVGRAEVLSSALEQRLAAEIESAGEGNLDAEGQVMADLRKLGRFAAPALKAATEKTSPQRRQRAWELLHLASVTPAEGQP